MKPCMMRDLFGAWNIPASDEEYAGIISKKIKGLYGLLAFGAVLLVLSVLNECLGFFPAADSFSDGVYAGVGAGLCVAAIVFLVRHKKLLKDAKALHARRIEEYDERKIEITRKVAVTTFAIFSVILFAAAMIAGFFSRTVFYCCYLGILLLALIFITVTLYYNKRM